MNTIDFGLAPYREIWEMQRKLQNELIAKKKEKKLIKNEYLLVGEHFPVYTLGFHGNAENLLINEEALKAQGCECIRIERGGDITFHGPGQIILYPIIDLEKHNLGVKAYVSLLEESVLNLLRGYGIKGERVEGATGIWIGKGTREERKICAIGVKISRGISMHGLALNVNTELSAFSAINPCGFADKGVTSMQKELGRNLEMEEVKLNLSEIFLTLLEKEI
ncbi:MAG: lipoyl(octanoyl) transferase LipB [Bacteroides sp.]|nr:lipoyl(octanoyl) transferase LipB [Bacteroides sp.]